MQMSLSARNKEILEITHMGKTIEWDISNFGRTKMVKDEEDFREINAFYAMMEPARQQNIYDVYLKIKDLFNVVMNFNE
jgi:hypothetical protein